ncbi:histone deacetylase family protein [Desulfoglaeba alkanexedens]|jgi:acetoin utilization deacetylase AcuC-like enzyme|uniref:Histone deacetylase n=1 Tax=Desulfoglaeba alkanexedens ALDC TaxID=980445 RepID=A0A4P8L4H3_9BACT|nr:histone deacetylase [Desulfoglaeba alkanexedens]QCQ22838.1 histone deacetylase [Desulfoglaeba alkanexedens ALDC]
MLTAPRKLGLVFFPAFDWAISPTHPEREERLLYTQDQVFEEGVLDIEGIEEFKPDLATMQDLRRVHFCAPDEWSVVTESHLISAGGAKTIAMSVLDRKVDRGLALVRPPGHHAMRVVHGARGFCNINIEAMMVEFLRDAYKIDRVAIVDTDCHHGDGTQDIYWHDPDTLYISLHQDGRTLYPGTGFPHELGGPTAVGSTINIPLLPRTSKEGFLQVIDGIVLPILKEFQPELVVNSAGQDNHYTDPITNMNFCAQGYAQLTERLDADIAVLEGGYSIEGALPYVNLGIILAMAGLDYHTVREPDYDPVKIRQSEDTTQYIDSLVGKVIEYWRECPDILEKNRNTKKFDERERTIFYDTDNILENQRERIRVCRDCSGVLSVDSLTDRGYHIFAVHVPRKACKACQELGREWFETANLRSYDRVFLQDRLEREYLIRKR